MYFAAALYYLKYNAQSILHLIEAAFTIFCILVAYYNTELSLDLSVSRTHKRTYTN